MAELAAKPGDHRRRQRIVRVHHLAAQPHLRVRHPVVHVLEDGEPLGERRLDGVWLRCKPDVLDPARRRGGEPLGELCLAIVDVDGLVLSVQPGGNAADAETRESRPAERSTEIRVGPQPPEVFGEAKRLLGCVRGAFLEVGVTRHDDRVASAALALGTWSAPPTMHAVTMEAPGSFRTPSNAVPSPRNHPAAAKTCQGWPAAGGTSPAKRAVAPRRFDQIQPASVCMLVDAPDPGEVVEHRQPVLPQRMDAEGERRVHLDQCVGAEGERGGQGRPTPAAGDCPRPLDPNPLERSSTPRQCPRRQRRAARRASASGAATAQDRADSRPSGRDQRLGAKPLVVVAHPPERGVECRRWLLAVKRVGEPGVLDEVRGARSARLMRARSAC